MLLELKDIVGVNPLFKQTWDRTRELSNHIYTYPQNHRDVRILHKNTTLTTPFMRRYLHIITPYTICTEL